MISLDAGVVTDFDDDYDELAVTSAGPLAFR